MGTLKTFDPLEDLYVIVYDDNAVEELTLIITTNNALYVCLVQVVNYFNLEKSAKRCPFFIEFYNVPLFAIFSKLKI